MDGIRQHSSVWSIALALVLLNIISGIMSELSEQACVPDPRLMNRTILCDLKEKIKIISMSVGFSEESCDYGYCPLQAVNETNEYYAYVENECTNKHFCMLSSVILFKNYSNHTFDICSHAGKSRNSVKLDYECVPTTANDGVYDLAPEYSRTAPDWTTQPYTPPVTQRSAKNEVTTPRYDGPSYNPYPGLSAEAEEISEGDEDGAGGSISDTDRILTHVVAPLLGALLALSLVILVICIVKTKRESSRARHLEDDEDLEIKFTTRNYINSSHNNSNADFEDSVTIDRRRRSLQRIEELSEADSCSYIDPAAHKRRYSNSNQSVSGPQQENTASWSRRSKAGSPGARGEVELVTLTSGRRISVSEQEDSGIAEIGSSMCSSCSSTNRSMDQEYPSMNKLPADELPDYRPPAMQHPPPPRENGLITKSELYQAIKDAVQDKYPETKRNTRCHLTRIAE